MKDRVPPNDTDAEVSLLGSVMISKDALALVLGRVKPDYFYRDSHASIFKAIIGLSQRNEPIDIVTVAAELKKLKLLQVAGGHSYIADLAGSVPTAANVEHYADIVIEKALFRKLITVGSDMVGRAFDEAEEIDDVLTNAQRQIMDISKERVQDEFILLKDVLMPVMDNIEKVYDSDNKILGTSTGMVSLDKLTSGFQPSDLIILAARPAMGKTTLALNFATNISTRLNKAVAVFSLEMPKEQLAMRLLCSEARIDSSRLRTANIQDHEYKELARALGKLSESPLYIDDTAGISPLEMRAKIRRLQMEVDLKLVVIDYLQLMRLGRKRIESRFQEVSEIVREIKSFAREAHIPIMALSQLSRDIEKRQDGLPKLSDLRESGEIEQTADLVMFIHREDYYDHGNEKTSNAKLIIAKQRNGPTGAVDLVFQKDISRFREVERRQAPLNA